MPLSAPVARAIRAVPAVSKQDVVVQFDNVRLDYAGKKKRITALDASNFSIRRGEFVAFTGPSGCGKSTILKLISGIIAPSAGSIFISGREIGAMPVRIGISFQNPTLLPWLTVRRNVMMPLRIVPPFKDEFRAKKNSEFLDRANALLAQVGLSKFADHYPWQLSGGMMQRASICRALIHDPTLLLLDEPFGALDAFTREELWGILQTLFIRHRPTVLLVTHDLNEAAFLADRIFTMTPSPGCISDESAANFARPRNLDLMRTLEFTSLTFRLRDLIADAHRNDRHEVV